MANDVLDRSAAPAQDAVLLLARLTLAALFIASGWGKLMNLDGFAGVLAGRGLPAAYPLAVLGTVVECLAALALVAGFKTRWAALALIAFTVVATLIAHRYWAVPPEQLTNQFNHFMKNVAIVGGLLAFVAAGPGRWSLDARAGR